VYAASVTSRTKSFIKTKVGYVCAEMHNILLGGTGSEEDSTTQSMYCILTKKHASWGLYTPSGKQTITITYDIPQGFKKFEDSDWKGVAFQQAEFEEKQIPFDMS
jgi:hypothetical protein